MVLLSRARQQILDGHRPLDMDVKIGEEMGVHSSVTVVRAIRSPSLRDFDVETTRSISIRMTPGTSSGTFRTMLRRKLHGRPEEVWRERPRRRFPGERPRQPSRIRSMRTRTPTVDHQIAVRTFGSDPRRRATRLPIEPGMIIRRLPPSASPRSAPARSSR